MSKDSNKQQVHDDDVRDRIATVDGRTFEEICKWLMESTSRIEYWNRLMKLVDPDDYRLMSVRAYGEWLWTEGRYNFAAFRNPFDWYGNTADQNWLIEMITQELTALLHEIPDMDTIPL